MKKMLSLIAVLMTAMCVCAQSHSPLRNINEQTYIYDFQNNNGNWSVGEGTNYADGDVTAPLFVGPETDQVMLTAIQGSSKTPVRIMNFASRGIVLVSWKGTSLKLESAEGRAIKKIVVTMQAGSFDLTNDNGMLSENVWTGNAERVLFANEKGSRYIHQIAVTVGDKDEETIEHQQYQTTFDFTSPTIREHIGTGLDDVQGYIYNETLTADELTLQITAGSAPSRIFIDGNRGQNLVTYKEYATLTFRAPEGMTITKIEFTAAGTSNINNFKASAGTIEGMTWTGNARGVRFLQGGTSYLANAIVTYADATVETTTLPAIEYVECDGIAAFNAHENGTYAKVTLTNAEVIGKSADGYSTVWMQDATGGCWIQYTSLNDRLTEGTKVNGVVYAVKRFTSGNPHMKEAEGTTESQFTAEEITDYTTVEGTIAQVNVAENLNRVVKIENASFTVTNATSGSGKLTQGEDEITIYNGLETANQQLHKIEDWTSLEKCSVVAILVAGTSKNQLLPISITDETVTGISVIDNDELSAQNAIYNLQGLRMNRLQRGVNIVGGKKLLVK